MRRLTFFGPLAGSIVVGGLTLGLAADDPKPKRPAPKSPSAVPSSKTKAPAAVPTAVVEAEALVLVRQHLPELLQVLEPLKATNPPEYRKAITEIAAEARTLADLRAKNPARAALALDAWKARSRVELIAAQLAGAASPERASQLRSAIEARVEVEIRRHQFEAEQAEAAVVRARENLARVEANRDRTRDALTRVEKNRAARVEARFHALQPKNAPPTVKKPTARPLPSIAAPPPLPTTSLHTVSGPSPSLAGGSQPMPSPESLAEGKTR